MTHILCGRCENLIAIVTTEFVEHADPQSVGIVLDYHHTKHQEAGCPAPAGPDASLSSASPCSSEPCSPVSV